jgi:copper chaperone
MSTSTTAAVTATYTVSGMTCGHCVSSVTAEVGKIDGVESVAVDLASGRVTVTASGPVGDDAVAAAVAEAGYEVVAAPQADDAADGPTCCGSCH